MPFYSNIHLSINTDLKNTRKIKFESIMHGKALAVIFGTSSSILTYKYLKSQPLQADNDTNTDKV